MFGALAGEAGRAQAPKDKRLAEEGFVYLAERGEKYLKHLDELSPSDVPAILAEMQSAAAVGGEYAESTGETYVIEYGGRKLITPDPGDPSAPLRTRWRELKDGWPPAASVRTNATAIRPPCRLSPSRPMRCRARASAACRWG